MRSLYELNQYRDTSKRVIALFGSAGDDKTGSFIVDDMRIIASSSDGWDHVSISLANRCPNWDEMELVKRLFFKETETAMQLHVPPDEHINCHPYCLHLWRPHHREIPTPPSYMVGIKS